MRSCCIYPALKAQLSRAAGRIYDEQSPCALCWRRQKREQTFTEWATIGICVKVFFNVSALFTLMPLLTPQKGKVAWFGALPVVLPSVARHGHGVPAATLLRTWPRKRSLCSTKTVLSNSFLGAFTQYCWCTKRPLIDCWLVGAFKLVVMCGGPDWVAGC